LRHQASLEGWV